ncbi:MAG TPA: O-antigen ligase family protein [Pseudolabrys sp.]|nr:O-antigen ligase family protein [Pseudolabrys sp.]
MVAVIPVLDWREVRSIIAKPAGGLPLLLVLLGGAGMLWAGLSLSVSWAERWEGLTSFLKLLAIPLLFVQFCRSERGLCVFLGFLAACVLLLVIGTLAEFVPGFSFIPMHPDHVPVKNAATQSGEFVACIAVLLYLTVEFAERRRWLWLLACIVVGLGMLANMLFVATGRTALVMLLVLVAVFALRRFRARGVIVLTAAAIAIGAAGWFASPYLRDRVEAIWTEYKVYENTDARTSSGERIEFWKKSIEFVRKAPLFGHGTGSIHALFIESSVGKTGAAGVASTNPHNQTFAVAIQLGVIGVFVLWAMWIAHGFMFRGLGLAEWIGLVAVVQNIIGSLFNSHLFDFGQGWIYVFGVGVAGGMVLNKRAGKTGDAEA